MTSLKFIALSTLYLLVFLGLEALILMLATGAAFNSIALPILNNLDFLLLLIKNNPGSGLRELIAQPVLIIGHRFSPNEYSSALYYYPISSLLHIAFACFVASVSLKRPLKIIRIPFLLASILLLTAINYVWLIGCCGATPGWTLDTMLLNYVLSANVNSAARMDFYEALYDWMTILQVSIIAVSVLLLRWVTR